MSRYSRALNLKTGTSAVGGMSLERKARNLQLVIIPKHFFVFLIAFVAESLYSDFIYVHVLNKELF